MNSNKKVSVITPVYNPNKYLLDTILSVQRQVFDQNKIDIDIIHIIIDDGSNNLESIELLNRLKKIKSINIIKQQRSGFSAARNKGIKFINTDFILPLDSGDIINPCFIDLLLKKINKEKENNCFGYSNWAEFGKFNRFYNLNYLSSLNKENLKYLPNTILIPYELAKSYKYDENIIQGLESLDLIIRLILNDCIGLFERYTGFYKRNYDVNKKNKIIKNLEIINYFNKRYPNFNSKLIKNRCNNNYFGKQFNILENFIHSKTNELKLGLDNL